MWTLWAARAPRERDKGSRRGKLGDFAEFWRAIHECFPAQELFGYRGGRTSSRRGGSGAARDGLKPTVPASARRQFCSTRAGRIRDARLGAGSSPTTPPRRSVAARSTAGHRAQRPNSDAIARFDSGQRGAEEHAERGDREAARGDGPDHAGRSRPERHADPDLAATLRHVVRDQAVHADRRKQ